MSQHQSYIFDTSALVDLEFWFRKSFAQPLWDKLEEVAKSGIFHCPREVQRELTKSIDLQKWVKTNHIVILDSVNANIIPIALDIDKKYPKLKIGGRRKRAKKDSADTWVVALAIYLNGKVVCSESPDPKARIIYKIPDACQNEGIQSISLPDLLDELNIRIITVR